ncbi:hypothetical protein K3495_g9377 [Podosphaera aphanis]|nr:hypothetical protein K3495_g9377 [Podosphaera aphanis]
MTGDEWWDYEDNTLSNSPERRLDARITHWPRPQELTEVELQPSSINDMSTRMLLRRYSTQKIANGIWEKEDEQQNMQAHFQKIETDLSNSKAMTSSLRINPSPLSPNTSRMVNLETLRALECESPRPQGTSQRVKNWDGIAKDSRYGCFDYFPQISNEHPTFADQAIPIGISLPLTGNESKGFPNSQTQLSNTTASSQRCVRQGTHNRNQSILQTPKMMTKTIDRSFWSPSSDGSITPGTVYFPKSSSSRDTSYLANDLRPGNLSVPKDENQGVNVEKRKKLVASNDMPTQREKSLKSSTLLLTTSGPRKYTDDAHFKIKKFQDFTPDPIVSSGNHLRVNTTTTHRLSQGWWNIITTPFLSPANSRIDQEREFPICLSNNDQDTNMKVEYSFSGKMRKSWENKSLPSTPIDHSSDPWWYLNSSTSRLPSIQESRKKVQTSSTETFSFVHSEAAFSFESESITSLVNDQETPTIKQRNLNGTQEFEFNHHEIRKIVTSTAIDTTKKTSQYSVSRIFNTVEQSMSKNLTTSTFKVKPNGQILLDEPRTDLVPGGNFKAAITTDHSWPSVIKRSTPKASKLQHSQVLFGGQKSISNIPLTKPSQIKMKHNLRISVSPIKPKNFECFQIADGKNKSRQRRKRKHTRYQKKYSPTIQGGGCWRVCEIFPKHSSCTGTKAKARKKQDWLIIFALLIFFIIILAVILAKKLRQVPDKIHEQLPWSNHTDFPPVPLGYATIISPIVIKETSACVFPSSKWSCHLPKELQTTISPNFSNRPNFFFKIESRNTTPTNTKISDMTTGSTGQNEFSTPKLVRYMFLKTKPSTKVFSPDPTPPSFEEELFLGRTTDGIVSNKKAGEPSPFYISFFQSPKATSPKRDISREVSSLNSTFPNISSLIPAPSINYDGTAAPANLLSFPSYQPLRFYDRGLPSEHYGFYSYFDRSIFLGTIDINNSTSADNNTIPEDSNGGASEDDASFRCTWSQTRFLVQIWTQKNNFSSPGDPKFEATHSNLAADMHQPGSFPYSTTITLDRHGGNPSTKMLYCYEMDSRKRLIASTGQISAENRGYGGVIINPAPTAFNNISNPSLGGFDGGTSGCSCQWTNFYKT